MTDTHNSDLDHDPLSTFLGEHWSKAYPPGKLTAIDRYVHLINSLIKDALEYLTNNRPIDPQAPVIQALHKAKNEIDLVFPQMPRRLLEDDYYIFKQCKLNLATISKQINERLQEEQKAALAKAAREKEAKEKEAREKAAKEKELKTKVNTHKTKSPRRSASPFHHNRIVSSTITETPTSTPTDSSTSSKDGEISSRPSSPQEHAQRSQQKKKKTFLTDEAIKKMREVPGDLSKWAGIDLEKMMTPNPENTKSKAKKN